MSTLVTLELPDELARRAKALAAATRRPVEEAMVEWIGQAIGDHSIQSLSDQQVLSLCNSALDAAQQDELSENLSLLREDALPTESRARLDELMDAYQRGMVLKAKAMKEAVSRGLIPPLDQVLRDDPQ